MTAPPLRDGTTGEVDGSDEQDHDAQEVALGALFTALILMWLLPGPSSLLGDSAAQRRRQVEAQVGPVLQGFIQRTAQDFARATTEAGVAGAYPHAAAASDDVYQRSMRLAESWAERSYQRLKGEVSVRSALPDAPGAPAPANIRQLAEVAGEADGRSVASYAKSEARNDVAGRVGALWAIWRTRHDDKVRETHRDLDGRKVPFGGKFVTDMGAYIRFPGDPEAPAAETMGCRCHLVYKYEPKGRSDDLYAMV